MKVFTKNVSHCWECPEMSYEIITASALMLKGLELHESLEAVRKASQYQWPYCNRLGVFITSPLDEDPNEKHFKVLSDCPLDDANE